MSHKGLPKHKPCLGDIYLTIDLFLVFTSRHYIIKNVCKNKWWYNN